jgi:hypothetical protein
MLGALLPPPRQMGSAYAWIHNSVLPAAGADSQEMMRKQEEEQEQKQEIRAVL